ncbi:hypothetical protein N9J26_01110 [bacterium]|nr:hypothetical protein [bacterium]
MFDFLKNILSTNRNKKPKPPFQEYIITDVNYIPLISRTKIAVASLLENLGVVSSAYLNAYASGDGINSGPDSPVDIDKMATLTLILDCPPEQLPWVTQKVSELQTSFPITHVELIDTTKQSIQILMPPNNIFDESASLFVCDVVFKNLETNNITVSRTMTGFNDIEDASYRKVMGQDITEDEESFIPRQVFLDMIHNEAIPLGESLSYVMDYKYIQASEWQTMVRDLQLDNIKEQINAIRKSKSVGIVYELPVDDHLKARLEAELNSY